ncbi:hypothetical protein KXR53_33710 [Inquilinus limosus]|uniref:hypothetical protein n=1 Tax=Inquilinus limosus TaxID=171674 RepID=UPI003F138C7B
MTAYDPSLASSSFANLRAVVDPSLAQLPARELRGQIDRVFGVGMADSIEQELDEAHEGIGRFFSSAARDIGRFATKAAPAVAHVGGGALQGAMAGSAAGLPGVIAGAAIGGAGAGLSRYGGGTARQIGGALSGVTSLAGQFTPMGRVGSALGSTVSGLGGAAGGQRRPAPGPLPQPGAAPGAGFGQLAQLGGLLSSPQAAGALTGLFGGSGAAGQLFSALQRSELQRALAAMRLGRLGRKSIPVGQAQVPVGNFAHLLAHLAQQVATEAAEGEADGEGEAAALAFMTDGAEGFVGDPALPSDRAARLWDMLNEAQAERLAEAIGSEELAEAAGWDAEDELAEEEYSADDELYDQLDLAEAEAIDYALSVAEKNDAW